MARCTSCMLGFVLSAAIAAGPITADAQIPGLSALFNSGGVQSSDPDQAKVKQNESKGCVAGGVIGGVIGGLLARKNAALGAFAGGLVGCVAGGALAKELTKNELKELARKSQEALDESPPDRSSTYESEDNHKTVTLTRGANVQKTRSVELETLEDVTPPPADDFVVVGRTYFARSAVRLRSVPAIASDNVIGSFRPNQAVFVMGRTEDSRWYAIGSDGVLIGYAASDLFSSNPLAPAVAKKTPAAKPVMSKGRDLETAQTTKIMVMATTSCAEVRQQVGKTTGLINGCKSPNGGWDLA